MKLKFLALAPLVAGAACCGAATAHTQSVADIFAMRDLIGTWSVDCAKPPGAANPRYVVLPPQAPGPVHRETLNGQPKVSTIIDVAHELGASELLVSLVDEGNPATRVKAVWLLERNRLRVMLFVTNDGRTIIAGGNIVASQMPVPWINKCGS
jgi:hypothetical protein